MACETLSTFSKVNCSAMTARQPSVPNSILSKYWASVVGARRLARPHLESDPSGAVRRELQITFNRIPGGSIISFTMQTLFGRRVHKTGLHRFKIFIGIKLDHRTVPAIESKRYLGRISLVIKMFRVPRPIRRQSLKASHHAKAVV